MSTELNVIQAPEVCCDPTEASVREHDHATAIDAVLPETAAVFKALSDETRLRIVRTMADSRHELCECNIVPLFGLSQSTISYHLKVLREAGIVESEKRGLWAYYRVNPRALMGVVKTLAELV
ncbi:MAG: metalloregulator ArsR/SmtB family transcription factor [Dehalococcoidia bacterium]